MTTTATKPRYLKTNYPTLYELAAENVKAGRRLLLGYCRRRTRSAMYDLLVDRKDAIERIFGTLSIRFSGRAGDGATMGDWRIRFTGRTARDAQYTELPFILDAK